MMTWSYVMPTWVFGVATVGVIGGGSVLVHWLLNRSGWRGFREHNDITGFILTIVGAIYAVVLGFVAVVVWEQYEASRQTEQHEINMLTALYHIASAFSPATRMPLRNDIAEYVRIVIVDEWPAMKAGKESARASSMATTIGDAVINLQDGRVPNLESQALSLAASFLDARRQRLQDNRSGIPVLLWVTLLLGGVLTVGLGYLFGIENLRFHATATGCTAAIIALILVLIARLDYPYRGDQGIPPTDWQAVVATLPAVPASPR